MPDDLDEYGNVLFFSGRNRYAPTGSITSRFPLQGIRSPSRMKRDAHEKISVNNDLTREAADVRSSLSTGPVAACVDAGELLRKTREFQHSFIAGAACV